MMLTIVLKYKLRQTYNSLIRSTTQKKLEWIIPLLLVPYFITLTKTMISLYDNAFGILGWTGLTKVVGTNSMMICVFVFVSTLALTIYRLFQSNDIQFLISLPISKGSLFGLKLLESLEDTARSMILPLPVIIAFSYMVAKITSILWGALIFVGWIAIIIQITSLSMFITLALGKIVSKSKWAAISKIIALVSALMLLVTFMRYFQVESQNANSAGSETASYVFSLLPASWLMDIIPYGTNPLSDRLFFALAFILSTIILTGMAYFLFKARFYNVLMETSEVERRKKPQHAKAIVDKQRGGIGSFILKELSIIKREPQMIVRLIIPLVMFPAFALIKNNDPKTQIIYIALVALIGTATYALTSIGREGKTFALLRSLPIKMSLIMWSKFLLSLIINLVITFIFVVFVSIIQKPSLNFIIRDLIIAVAISAYLSAMGLGLSALFPKFDWTNPARAVSVPGFFGFYLVSILFTATLALFSFVQWFFAVIGVFVWTVIAILLLKFGQKKLEKMDISGF
jgi:ABC-2 type transport system permease protein